MGVVAKGPGQEGPYSLAAAGSSSCSWDPLPSFPRPNFPPLSPSPHTSGFDSPKHYMGPTTRPWWYKHLPCRAATPTHRRTGGARAATASLRALDLPPQPQHTGPPPPYGSTPSAPSKAWLQRPGTREWPWAGFRGLFRSPPLPPPYHHAEPTPQRAAEAAPQGLGGTHAHCSTLPRPRHGP